MRHEEREERVAGHLCLDLATEGVQLWKTYRAPMQPASAVSKGTVLAGPPPTAPMLGVATVIFWPPAGRFPSAIVT